MDRDGFISNGELFLVLKMMVGNNLKDGQLQQIVDKTIMEADQDGDGKLSFEEFAQMVSNTVRMSIVVWSCLLLRQGSRFTGYRQTDDTGGLVLMHQLCSFPYPLSTSPDFWPFALTTSHHAHGHGMRIPHLVLYYLLYSKRSSGRFQDLSDALFKRPRIVVQLKHDSRCAFGASTV